MAETEPTKRRARRWTVVALSLLAAYLLVWFMSQILKPSDSRAGRDSQPPLPYDWGPLPVVAGAASTSHIEPRLGRIASAITGRSVEVRCWSPREWNRLVAEFGRWPGATKLGPWSAFTSRDRKRINFSPAVCAQLADVLYNEARLEGQTQVASLAWSVNLLGHESQHVLGIADEATAECYGMQSISRNASLLGLSESEGRRLADAYWADSYPTLADPIYQSPACRNGGALDLRPESDVWP